FLIYIGMTQRERNKKSRSDPDAALKTLQGRFRSLNKKYDRKQSVRTVARSHGRKLIFGCLCTCVLIIYFYKSPWDFKTTWRHLAAMPNCSFARGVGLSDIKVGEPGYYKRHDRDGDGIACEPY